MVRKRGKHWYTDFPFEGKRIRQKTGQTTKMAAEEFAIELLKSLRTEKSARANPTIQVEVPAPQLATPPTLKEFADQYFLPWIESHAELRGSSKAGYRYGWSMLATQRIANMKMADITKSDLDGLKLEWDPRRRRGTKVVWLPLKDRDPKHPWTPVSPSTHNCALRTLSRMFTLALEKKKVPGRYRIPLRREKERTKLGPGVEDRVGEILLKGNRRGSLQTALYAILDAGMRPQEIADMQIPEIHFLEHKIYVPDSKTAKGVRDVAMTPRLEEKLRRQIGTRTSGWVFPSPLRRRKGLPIRRQALTSAWKKMAKKAGLESDVNLYCARHTYGTDAMAATKNLFLVMDLMGHQDPKTAKRYQHPDTEGAGQKLAEYRRQREEGQKNVTNLVTVDKTA